MIIYFCHTKLAWTFGLSLYVVVPPTQTLSAIFLLVIFQSFDDEADKLDLEQKMYPLSHYISDQEELVNQMFLTLSGSKLEAMLPPVLKVCVLL